MRKIKANEAKAGQQLVVFNVLENGMPTKEIAYTLLIKEVFITPTGRSNFLVKNPTGKVYKMADTPFSATTEIYILD